MKIRVLIACEESQTVTKEFRALGHEAFSCDIEPCSGGHSDWHFQQDVSELLKQRWDIVIGHPPCTRLTVTANKWYKPEYSHRFPNIHQEREDAVKFFMLFTEANSDFIAIENPVGIMSTRYKKPTQIVQPYMFGEPHKKTTCLWLKGLPKLQPTNIVEPEIIQYNGKNYPKWMYEDLNGVEKKERQRRRSVTFPGFAKAMATQWSEYVIKQKSL